MPVCSELVEGGARLSEASFSLLWTQGPGSSRKQWVEAECLSNDSALATSVTSGKSLKPSFVHLSSRPKDTILLKGCQADK